MKKNQFVSLILFLIIFLMIGVIVWGSSKKRSVFYYGNTCPHCKEVEDWMEENKIEEKLKIVKKEVYDNKANASELFSVAKKCGINSSSIGVPFLYTQEGKCLIGTPDVTNYLKEKAGL
jgi:glutaredoxin